MKKISYIAILSALLLPIKTFAHCPLCTFGAGVIAIGAGWLGVTYAAVGVFVGAFSFALGFWVDKLLKKQWVKGQGWILALFSFATTIFPLQMLFEDYYSFYFSFFGDYGSLFNSTYIIGKFFVGSVVGALIIVLSPVVSKKLSEARKGLVIPYQGMLITFGLLSIAGLLFQFLL